MMRVGFTGTRDGMTPKQWNEVYDRLLHTGRLVLVHGDCVGSDAQAHDIAIRLGHTVEIRPPNVPTYRAFCIGAAVVYQTAPYLERDRDIVDSVDFLLATPKSLEDCSGGTWYTINYAKKRRVPMLIVGPKGNSLWEIC